MYTFLRGRVKHCTFVLATVSAFTLLGMPSARVNGTALRQPAPLEIGSIAGARSLGFSWVSATEAMIWSMDPASSVGSDMFLRNVADGSQVNLTRWSSLPDARPSSISFASRYGAWMVPGSGSPSSELRWMYIDGIKPHAAKLEDGDVWYGPVWIGKGVHAQMVVFSRSGSGAVRAFEPGSDSPVFERDFDYGTNDQRNVSSLVGLIGAAADGTVIGIGLAGHNRSRPRVVQARLTETYFYTSAYSAILPADMVFCDAALCGDKVAWMLERPDAQAKWTAPIAAGEYQLWSSDLNGSRFEPILLLPAGPSIEDSPAMYNRPCLLQARPDGTAVSYVQNAKVYLVPLK